MINRISTFAAIVTCSVTALCAGSVGWGMPAFGEWTLPAKVASQTGSVGPINTPAVDGCVSLSRDGLELYFTSNRTGTFQLYVARRSSMSSGFGAPVRLSGPVNDGSAACPSIIGRNTLYFIRASNDDPGDVYVAHRSSGGWGTPEPVYLMNTSQLDETVASFEDEQGRTVLLWSSRNPDGSGGVIYQSIAGSDPEPVPGSPNEAGSNNRASITHDGLTLYFDSTRAGGLSGPDIYVATRASTSEPFGPATLLSDVSSPAFDARPWISWDGTQLFYSSARSGSTSPAPDVWMAMRTKRSGPKTVEFGSD